MNILEKSIRAIGGVFNEKLRAYFKSYGATSNVLQDAEKEYLKGRGLTFGANQDAWKQLEERFGTVIPLEVSDILKKYNGTLLLPGASGVQRYGFQPGNYVESTGQTLATVDGAVSIQSTISGNYTTTHSTLGARGSGTSELFPGHINGVLTLGGAPTSAERATIRTFLASLQGRTL